MASPGSRVMPAERSAMICATEKIMSRVWPSCLRVPLTVSVRRSACGSPISSAVTITGPIETLPLEPLGGPELEVARRHVIENGVAKDMVERARLLDVPAAQPDDDA